MLIFATTKRFLPCNAIGIMLKFRNYWECPGTPKSIQIDTHVWNRVLDQHCPVKQVRSKQGQGLP